MNCSVPGLERKVYPAVRAGRPLAAAATQRCDLRDDGEDARRVFRGHLYAQQVFLVQGGTFGFEISEIQFGPLSRCVLLAGYEGGLAYFQIVIDWREAPLPLRWKVYLLEGIKWI